MVWNVAVQLIVLQMASAAPAVPAKPPVSSLDDPLPVQLVVSDRFGFHKGFLASVGREVEATLRTFGVDATWSPDRDVNWQARDHSGSADAAVSFVVILAENPPTEWNAKATAMGMVVPSDLPRRRVIVFPLRLLRVLQARRQAGGPTNAWYSPPIGRAMARVVVHELMHAIAPEHSAA